jgi:NAD(P)-dependent dehydrogenase (short-subunit alcohol dehydrogenase family)
VELPTEDGLESNFAANYLGRFLLTQRLLPLLKASTPARIVLIGAAGANPDPKLDFENLQGERQFAGFAAISQSHFANDLFVAQLARQLTDTGVTVNALHPGLVNTGIMRSAPLPMKLLSPFFALRADSVEEGAKAPVYLVTAGELTGTNGSYFRKMKPIAPAPSTFDAQLGRRLWQISEQLIQQILAETAHSITA